MDSPTSRAPPREKHDDLLSFLLNRWYDPQVGRWISEDPIGFAGGDANLARYVNNNPLTHFDPLGLQSADSTSSSIAQAAARGDVGLLEDLIATGGLSEAQAAAAQAAIERLKSTCAQIIAKECKGSVWREFPRQFKDNTLKEIIDLAKQRVEDAQKCLKLLRDRRFKK